MNILPLSRYRPVRLAYQPPASSTFLSEQISHQQPANSTFLSEQTSTSHQPPANRTGCMTVTGKIFQQPRQPMKVPATPISGGMARWAGGWTGLVLGRSDFFYSLPCGWVGNRSSFDFF
jgi:hypothetical protein